MNFKKIISLLMCMVITLSCFSFVYAEVPVVKVSISIGVGETKDLSTYMKSDTGVVTWTKGDSAIAAITEKTLKGVKVGTTTYIGTTKTAKYEFTIKVLDNFSTPAVIQTDTNTNVNSITNSNGDKITYKDRYITMGVNDTLDLSYMVNADLKYFNYSWSVSNEKYLTFKQGKVTTKAEGVVRVNARPRTTKEKNVIYRFFITIDSNYLSKNISVSKNTLTPLSTYIGDDANNYVFNVTNVSGASVSVSGSYIKAATNTGVSILTAESTTGGTNYCFVVKTR